MNRTIPDKLLVAIASGEAVSLEDILGLELDLNALGLTINRTLLTAGAFAGNSGLILGLVEHGALLDQGGGNGLNALHEAASMGQLDAVRTLLDLGANIEAETPGGLTPLMLASAWDECEVISLLLARGANIHHRANRGDTALMIARIKGRENAIALLIAAGGDDEG